MPTDNVRSVQPQPAHAAVHGPDDDDVFVLAETKMGAELHIHLEKGPYRKRPPTPLPSLIGLTPGHPWNSSYSAVPLSQEALHTSTLTY